MAVMNLMSRNSAVLGAAAVLCGLAVSAGPAVAEEIPPVVGVPVPNLDRMILESAQDALSEAGLRLCDVVGDGVVVRQIPEAGALVARRSCVSVTLSEPVVVPEVREGTVDAAREEVERLGLVLSGGGEDGTRVVHDQDPSAGTEVFAGDTVTVEVVVVTPAPVDEVLVTVPNLKGLTVSEAEPRLDRVGLVLAGGGADPDRRVSAQRPAADARVPADTAVTVVLEVVAGSTSSSDDTSLSGDQEPASQRRLVIGGIGILAVLLAALAGWAALRRWSRRSQVPASPEPRFRPHSDPGASARLGPSKDRPMPMLRLRPHSDPATDPVLTEVPR